MERRKNSVGVWTAAWMDHYFDLPLWGRAVLMGFVAALLMFVMDEVAHLFGYPWYMERLLENALEGIVVGFIVFWLGSMRKKRMERRMREIAFLNHHIRNAMQAIAFAATGISDAEEREAVEASVRRVVETLSKINRETNELTLSGFHYAA